MTNSIQENLARVRAGVAEYDSKSDTHGGYVDNPIDHERILQEHDAAIREHERQMEGHRQAIHGHRRKRERDRSETDDEEESRTGSSRSLKFRFKDDRHRRHDGHTRHKRRKRRDDNRDQHASAEETRSRGEPGDIEEFVAHPFARPSSPQQYLDPSLDPGQRSASIPRRPSEDHDTDAAFRTSLFDALADDEGAATYWEAVYGDPIHVYSRPKVPTSTDDGAHEPGTLEAMNDDEYAEYVKQKMWERKNPHLMREIRLRADQERRTKEEKAEGKSYGARRSERHNNNNDCNSAFMNDVDEALARGAKRKDQKKWRAAWAAYTQRWEALKTVQDKSDAMTANEITDTIPWPVAGDDSKPFRSTSHEDMAMSRDEVEAFFLHAPLEEAETLLSKLKTERLRWHPDKIQHRFGGANVGPETLQMVTSVFLTIDDLLARERKTAESQA